MEWHRTVGIGLIVMAVVMAGGCVRRPKKVLSNSKMAAVVADMELAEAYVQTQPGEQNPSDYRAELTAGILKRHGVTREEFDSTMNWYGRNIDEYYKLDDEVNRELLKRQKDLARKGGGVVEQQTTIDDIWPYKRTAVIWQGSGSNILDFSLSTSDIAKGSSMSWSMKLRQPVESLMMLGVEYADGNVAYVNRSMSGQKRLETTLQTDTARVVNRVFGFFSVKETRDMPVFMDSIVLMPRPVDSTQYYKINSQRFIGKPSRPKPTIKSEVADSLRAKDSPNVSTKHVSTKLK